MPIIVEKEQVNFNTIDIALILRGLQFIRTMSIIEHEELDNLILKVKSLIIVTKT